jgi:hypothetical protein
MFVCFIQMGCVQILCIRFVLLGCSVFLLWFYMTMVIVVYGEAFIKFYSILIWLIDLINLHYSLISAENSLLKCFCFVIWFCSICNHIFVEVNLSLVGVWKWELLLSRFICFCFEKFSFSLLCLFIIVSDMFLTSISLKWILDSWINNLHLCLDHVITFN